MSCPDRHAVPEPEAQPAHNDRLKRLLDHSPSVVYACLPGNLQLTYVSDSVGHLLGYDPEHLLGDPGVWDRLVHPDDAPNLPAASARAFTHGQRTLGYRIRHADGSYVWVQDDLRLVRDTDGTPIEMVGTLLDVGARMAAEAAQRGQLAQLAGANHALTQAREAGAAGQLAAQVAHEINNPLSYVSANLGTLHAYFNELATLVRAAEQAAIDCGGNPDLLGRLAQLRVQAGLDHMEQDAQALVAESMDGVRRMRDVVRGLVDFPVEPAALCPLRLVKE